MQSRTDNPGRKIAYCGVLCAVAMIFSYIEALVPAPVPVPGIKLGLANVVILVVLYSFGPGYALPVNLVRIVLTALLFTNVQAMIYSLCAGMVSLLAMWLLKRLNCFGILGISMMGGVFHNLTQLAAAMVLSSTFDLYVYLPVLEISGALCGLLCGFVSYLILSRGKSLMRL